jgi:hypothetical protein
MITTTARLRMEGGLLLSRVQRDIGPPLRVRDRLRADFQRYTDPRPS